MAAEDQACFLGVDIGGTSVKLALFDSEGQLLIRGRVPTMVEKGPADLVARTAEEVKRMLVESGTAGSAKAMGIGSPGPLSSSRGAIISAANLPAFDGYPLRAELSKATGIPAVLHNDANAACWGEYWLGAGRDAKFLAMFTLGTGVGGGIIIDGEMFMAQDGNGAELGHMVIMPEGRRCNCGQNGCLEAYASASHTAVRAGEHLAEGATSSLQAIYQSAGEVTSEQIFEHAANGDAFALSVIDKTMWALGMASLNVYWCFEVERIVLAGGMVGAGNLLLDGVKKHLAAQASPSIKPLPEICLASLGSDAGVIGAAGLGEHAYRNGTLYDVGV